MNIMEITKNNFADEVLDQKIPVLVDFWAPWCGHCRRLSPLVDKLSESYEGKLKIAKLNIDDAMEIAEQYEIMTIPTLMVFKSGKEGERLINPQSKGDVDKWLKAQGIEL